jgi:hypothetical protein
MLRDIPERDGPNQRPAELDADDTPFEAVPGRGTRKGRGRARSKKKRASIALFAFLAIVYALGATVAGVIGHDLLLLAWLVAGPVIVMIIRMKR